MNIKQDEVDTQPTRAFRLLHLIFRFYVLWRLDIGLGMSQGEKALRKLPLVDPNRSVCPVHTSSYVIASSNPTITLKIEEERGIRRYLVSFHLQTRTTIPEEMVNS
jgi:hypothetical protein